MIDRQFIASSPAEVGIDEGRLRRLHEYVEGEVADGLPSAQLAIGRRGRVASLRTWGEVTADGKRVPATDEHLYCLFSATKGVVGVAMWALIEDGLLRLDERVSEIIPEFVGHGKDEITVLQVLTFTGGFPLAPLHPRLWEDRAGRVARMAGWWLNWEPGSKYEYHPTTAHWVLVEIIERKTGVDFREYIPQRVTRPMGVPELFVGMPEAFHARAADVEYAGYVDAPDAAGGAGGSVETRLGSNRPEQRRAGSPGSGGWGGAGELALFYQRLVSPAESGTYAVIRPDTIAMATHVHTLPHHVTERGIPANRGLSVSIAGDHGVELGFGEHASPRAFGHAGAGGQIAWGDPSTGLSVGFVTNGFSPNERISVRTRTIGTLAAECVI